MKFLQTQTGDLMQVSECKENEVTFGIISIKLKEAFTNLDTAQNVVTEFIQQLQTLFAIQHATGVTLDFLPVQHKITVTDYWQDAAGLDWKVKGWTDGRSIAVLYIKNIGFIDIQRQESFLNGTLFTTG